MGRKMVEFPLDPPLSKACIAFLLIPNNLAFPNLSVLVDAHNFGGARLLAGNPHCCFDAICAHGVLPPQGDLA